MGQDLDVAGCKVPVWRISNKYYSAEVALAQHTLPADSSSAPALQLSEGCEALVLVFDASSPTSFAAVKAWADASETDSPAIRLVVATHVDLLLSADQGQQSGKQLDPMRPKWLDEAIDWACSNCFEYIETSPQYADLDARLQLDGDQQGIQRVRDALIAHMWSNHVPVMKASRPQAADARASIAPVDRAAAGSSNMAGGLLAPLLQRHGDSTNCDETGMVQQQATLGNTPSQEAANNAAATAVAGFASTAPMALQPDEQCTAANGPSKSNGTIQAHTSRAPDDGLIDDPDSEGDGTDDPVRPFEDLMKQVMDTKQRVAHMPDAERRAAAAAMALQFAAMFGGDDGSGGSEGTESDE